MMYTTEQRAEMIKKMHEASSTFYSLATRTGNHAFIEFTGFMNEYIKLCEDAQRLGIDFTETNIHLGEGAVLPIHDYHAAYIGEKFGCIFGKTLSRDPKLFEAFVTAMKEGT